MEARPASKSTFSSNQKRVYFQHKREKDRIEKIKKNAQSSNQKTQFDTELARHEKDEKWKEIATCHAAKIKLQF